MTSKERVLKRERERGRVDAQQVQIRSAEMTGTELNAVCDCIPEFTESVKVKNMLERPVGFVCKSSEGRVVKLLQNYDSEIYKGEPEEYPALFGFKWSNDPSHAKPFISLSTSPYMTGDCCKEDGAVFRSKVDNNVFSPSHYPEGWEEVEE